MLPVPSFDELFDDAQRAAVHLETHDTYAVDRERGQFAEWLRTGERSLDPASEYWRPWSELVNRTVARGVAMCRARVVSEPASEYIRYEHAGTQVNIALGEEVRWLPRRNASDLALPGNDFWLIDDSIVRFNLFSGDGNVVDPQVSDDPAVIKLCSAAFESVWERAIPHGDYRLA